MYLKLCVRSMISCPHPGCWCRYLVSGADESSLWLEVKSVEGSDVICTAQNDAVMDGLLTVTHHSANPEDKGSMQADLPLLSEHDVHAIRDITSQYEVDFVALTFTRDGGDVDSMRDFLDKLGLEQTKILAKVWPPCKAQHLLSCTGESRYMMLLYLGREIALVSNDTHQPHYIILP